MGMMGVAGMGVGAVTSVMAANAANKQVEATMATNRKYAMQRRQGLIDRRGVLQGQTLSSRDAETLKQLREADAIRGAVRASAESAGMSTGGGTADLRMAHVDQAHARRLGVLDQNTANMFQKINSEYSSGQMENMMSYENSINAAMANAQDPLLAGISGGMSGAATGLSMADNLGMIKK